MSWTSVHSSSVCLSDLIPWIYWSLPLYNHKGFDLGHTWMAYWFSLFSSILNFAVRISWSEPQSVPCLVFADCIVLHHLCCKEYNQSDFSIDHLVMSTCRVFSCVVGRGCLLWPVHFLGKTLSLCPASFRIPRPNLPVTPGVSWLPTFCIPVPYNEKDIFFGC